MCASIFALHSDRLWFNNGFTCGKSGQSIIRYIDIQLRVVIDLMNQIVETPCERAPIAQKSRPMNILKQISSTAYMISKVFGRIPQNA